MITLPVIASFWETPLGGESGQMQASLLLVEDDDTIRETIRDALCLEGFEVTACGNGRDALQHLQIGEGDPPFSLVVLDLMLPGLGGLEVCRQLRQGGDRTPILVVSARDSEADRVLGLEIGADDYLVKPFATEELVLRLRALIRRSGGHAHPQLVCGALALDDNAGRFSLHGEELAVTAQEHRILAYLMHRRDAIVSRTELGEHVYDQGYDPDSNVLDVLIGRIRRKIGAERLVTERGKGFRLVDLP